MRHEGHSLLQCARVDVKVPNMREQFVVLANVEKQEAGDNAMQPGIDVWCSFFQGGSGTEDDVSHDNETTVSSHFDFL